MSDGQDGSVGVVLRLTKEHGEKLNLQGDIAEKISSGKGSRESQVTQYAHDALFAYQLLYGKQLAPEALHMFCIGYTLRGIDSQIDFEMEACEFMTSIIETLVINNNEQVSDLFSFIAKLKGFEDDKR